MDFTVEIDPEADAAHVRASQAPIFRSQEMAGGRILDVDFDGRIVGIEVLSDRAWGAATPDRSSKASQRG